LATHKSAIKRAKQNEVRRQRNRAVRTRVKSVVKEVRISLEKQSVEEARAALQKAVPVIDRAVSRGALHHRTAARKISRLSKKVHALGVEQQ
jgi:small subunit ribosomal protein S20